MKNSGIRKPLASRNNKVALNADGTPNENKPVVPRMLRRTTRQSFMDLDLAYLMKLDPTTPDPFESASNVLSDPPSLFRPLPHVAAAAAAIAQGAGPWAFQEAARLQKEQEDLRVQYLQFLHNLNVNNPHGFLAHMNTFATEFPQEFVQLQSYIQYQEQVMAQQKAEQEKQAAMIKYQQELEEKNRKENELRQLHLLKEQQQQEILENQRQVQQELFREWLMKRQQSTTIGGHGRFSKDANLVDLFALAFQRDHHPVQRNPQQQQELLQQHQLQQQQLMSALLLTSPSGNFTSHQQQQIQQLQQQQQMQQMQHGIPFSQQIAMYMTPQQLQDFNHFVQQEYQRQQRELEEEQNPFGFNTSSTTPQLFSASSQRRVSERIKAQNSAYRR